MAWNRLNNRKEVLAHADIAHGIAKRSRDPELLGIYYGYYADLHQNDWKTALVYYQKALALMQNPANRISTLNSIVHGYVEHKQADSALYYIRQAQALVRKFPNLIYYDQLHSLDNWGHYYLLKKEYRKAQEVLLQVYETAQEAGAIDIIMHIAPHLASAFVATRDYQTAYQFVSTYSQLKDSIFENQKSQSLNDWLEMKGREHRQLSREQQLIISLQKSQIHSRNLWIATAIFSLLFVCTLFLWLYHTYKQKHKLQKTTIKSMEKEQDIIQLKAQVRGEEQERKRIGKELHDGIASELWAIKMNIASMQGQASTGQIKFQDLEVVHQQLVNAAKDIRDTAHNLIPDQLGNGLSHAVKVLCKKMSYQTKLEIDFQQYGLISKLNQEIELSLYRMIQELINNCLKHADCATYLLVQISCSDKLLNITVEDNGSGFENYEDRIKEGQVLHTVQQRVQTLKGFLDIQSMEGIGSTIYLEFDLNNLV